MTTNDNIKSLHERAMLVRHSIQRKQFRKFDREATHKIASDNGADLDEAGRFNKILISRDALQTINRIAGAAYRHHLANTLPWDDDGQRLLPSENYFEYTKAQREYQARFETAVGEFVTEYPQYIEEAKKRLNGMFQQSDYPDPEIIAEAFSMAIRVRPLPNVDDIRAGLPEAEQKRIKEQLESDLQDVLNNAIADLWARLDDSLSVMRNRLRDYANDDDARFYSTWVDSVRDICTLVGKLNFTNDPSLDRIREKTLTLVDFKYDNEDLKEDKKQALMASKDADAILKEMAGYIGG